MTSSKSVEREFLDGLEPVGRGVVDDHVEPAARHEHRVHDLHGRMRLTEVGANGKGAPSRLRDCSCDGL